MDSKETQLWRGTKSL